MTKPTTRKHTLQNLLTRAAEIICIRDLIIPFISVRLVLEEKSISVVNLYIM